ncbi:MAG TPA: hypothetical protein VFC53_09955 [Dehalococcoidia bacterium]|nr:hypothetical protein [Dehalococcoidia bacterium]
MNIVLAGTPKPTPVTNVTGFPRTGSEASSSRGIARGLLGALVLALGLGAIAAGLRMRDEAR